MRPSWIAAPLVALCACHVGQRYEKPRIEAPAAWTEALTTTPNLPDELGTRWWSSFHDAELDALIQRAIESNLDLKIARARVLEARALRDVTAGGYDPQVDVSAGYTRGSLSANTLQGQVGGNHATDLYQVGFDARWEIDLFGRREDVVGAADAGVEAAVEGRRDALVSLLGEVAREYVELRGLQRQIALTRANLALQRDTEQLTRSRATAGMATDLDVVRAEAQAESTAAQIPASAARVRVAIHSLGVLLGVSPGALAAELEVEAPLPDAPETVPAGLPSDLLRRRPDVRRAERQLAQATELTSAATADLFPRFSLGASIGQAAQHMGDLFDGDSTAWSVGGSLVAPIFNGGSLRAQVRVQDARQEQALFAYQKTVLQSLAEVEDALSNVARERERVTTLSSAVTANRRAVALATDLYKSNLQSFFEVLDAQRTMFVAESELASSQTTLAAQTVALYKALGGGWELDDDEVVAHAAPEPR